jgi:peroxiredoxin family protein/rhodanese-related sulfurtransferase/TusA-related sulfurtransferase
VTLVELADQVMGPVDPEMAALLHQELQLHGVDLLLGASVSEFRENGAGLEVVLSSGGTVSCGLAIVSIGVKPEVTLARDAGLEIGELGGIAVDEHLRTSDPGIYAVGDAVEVRDFVLDRAALIPLAGPANRQGRIAADNIVGRSTTYKKTQGTAICKVFNLAIGMTGPSEKSLRSAGLPCEKVYVHPLHHAGYYPGARPVSLKLLFDPAGGKILGAQAVGADGVDKRIDVLAMAQRAGLTVYDLEEAELSYAPPYGSAKDIVNYAGFAAANVLRGDVRICHVADVQELAGDAVLVDVRTAREVKAGSIPDAMHIPLDELRDRSGELPREKEIVPFCQEGLRSYIACRLLSQRGFRCRHLSGGYKTYRMVTGKPIAPRAAARAPAAARGAGQVAREIDACGLQCPGPIQKLKEELDSVAAGEAVRIVATDPGFVADIPAWCHSTGHELVEVAPDPNGYCATLIKRGGNPGPRPAPADGDGKGLTIVAFSNDFDRMMAAFIIANGAATMGYEVTIFFTFWGLNVLRRGQPIAVKKTLVERLFGWMMPRGPEKLALSKMHMAGMGRAMIKGIMRQKNVSSLPQLIKDAQAAGVRLVACSMSMDLMGIKREELIDGVEGGGVAMYLDRAGTGRVNLFI